MSKFKVGDRVKEATSLPPNTAKVVEVDDRDRIRVHWDGLASDGVCFWCADDFELIAPVDSPAIRTVTRREIVPGSYGCLEWWKHDSNEITLSIDDEPFTAKDLREAAHLFNQFAEVLEESATSGKPANDWIEWHGGKCPVDGGAYVEVELRSGRVLTPCTAGELAWYGDLDDGTITAYRVLPCAS